MAVGRISPSTLSLHQHARETRHFTIVPSKKPVFKHISRQQIITMALLVDKHRPRSLDALSYHPELSDRLKALVKLPTFT
jgi:hypothetical protein